MNASIAHSIRIIPSIHYNRHETVYLKKVDGQGFEGFCLSWQHPTGQQTGQTSIAGKLEYMAMLNGNAPSFLREMQHHFSGSLAQLIIPQENIACQDRLDHDAPQPFPALVGNHPEFNIPALEEQNSEYHVYILPSVALTFGTQTPRVSGAILFTLGDENREEDIASINICKFYDSDDLRLLNIPLTIDGVEGVQRCGGITFGTRTIA